MVRHGSLLVGALMVFVARSAHAELPPPGSPDSRPLIPTSAPPEQYPPAYARGQLALAGAGMFVGFYGAAVAQSYGWSGATAHERLLIPVVGPWMTIAHAGCTSKESDCSDFIAVVRAVFAGISALGQVGGLAVLGESAFMRTEPPQPKLARPATIRVQNFSVLTTPSSVGLGISGAF
ncbi:MAG: hypothetical protein QM756_38265 [Polyangiaceae bacterium]